MNKALTFQKKMDKAICGPWNQILLMEKNKLEEGYDLNFEEFDLDPPTILPGSAQDLSGTPSGLDRDPSETLLGT
jgi:hypothetical protein